MSFPDKEARENCWNARDKYWDCLESSNSNEKSCVQLRKLFESNCPAQWVKHFDRKRSYLKYKEQIEKHGYDPLESK